MNTPIRADILTGQSLMFSANFPRPQHFPQSPNAMHYANHLRPQTPLYNLWGNDNNSHYTSTVIRTENQIITTRVRQNDYARPYQYHLTGPRGGTLPLYPMLPPFGMPRLPIHNTMDLHRRNADLQIMLHHQHNYIILQQEVMALQQQVSTLKLRSTQQQPTGVIPIEPNNLNIGHYTDSTTVETEDEGIPSTSDTADLSNIDQSIGSQPGNISQNEEEVNRNYLSEYLLNFPALNDTTAKKIQYTTREDNVLQRQPIKEEIKNPWQQTYMDRINTVSYNNYEQQDQQQEYISRRVRKRRENFRNCQVCQLKYNNENNPVVSQSNNGLLNQLAIHLIGPIKTSNGREKIIFVLKDVSSNWSEFHPHISKDIRIVRYVLYTHFKIHGTPETILVEDEVFQSNGVKRLLEDWNVKQALLSESTYDIGNLQDILNSFLKDKHWEENLKLLQNSLNSTKCKNTNITPAELFLGQRKTRKMLNRCEVCSSDPSTYEHANEHTQKQILNIHEFLKNHEPEDDTSSTCSEEGEEEKEENIRDDILTCDIMYEPDDLVFVWCFDYKNSEEGIWKGPYKVLAMLDDILVQLQDTQYPFTLIKRHKIQIKPYKEEQKEESVPQNDVQSKNDTEVQSVKKQQNDSKHYKTRIFRSSQ